MPQLPFGWAPRIMLVAWWIYAINGYRPPWQPIIVSDADSGAALRKLIFGLSGMAALAVLFLGRRLGPALMRQLPLTVLAVGMLGSVVWSDSGGLTIKRGAIFVFALLTMAVAVDDHPEPVRFMQKVVIWMTGGAAWISLVGMVIFPKLATSIAERPGLCGVTGHPNTLGAVLSSGYLVSLGLRSRTHREFFCYLGLRGGQILALFLSNSVTSLILVVSGTGLFLFLWGPHRLRGQIQVAAVTGITLVMLIGPANCKSMAFKLVGRDESLSGRDELWKEVFREGMKSPVFGRGYGAFWREGRGREIVGTWNPRQSHNAYVDVFVDIGVVGLFVVVFSLVSPLPRLVILRARLNEEGRRTVCASATLATGLLVIYAFGESYLLKTDKVPMLCLMWTSMVLRSDDPCLRMD
ncbi:MAG: O-antigen ligase family protein [Acidobacteriota bacterium]